MNATVKLGVETVIGTGDPLDVIMLIPLIHDWNVPRECIMGVTGTPCEAPIRRIYVLREPLVGFGGGEQGFKHVGICEAHHRQFKGESDG